MIEAKHFTIVNPVGEDKGLGLKDSSSNSKEMLKSFIWKKSMGPSIALEQEIRSKGWVRRILQHSDWNRILRKANQSYRGNIYQKIYKVEITEANLKAICLRSRSLSQNKNPSFLSAV